ncbi:MAG: hypothetical protein ABH870_05885, partial [bacterium]
MMRKIRINSPLIKRVRGLLFIGALMLLWTQAAQSAITGTVTTPSTGAVYAGSSSQDIVWTVAGGKGTHAVELWL